MEIITLVSNKGMSNTYIIKNNNHCVIIDCGVTLSAIKQHTKSCIVDAIMLTHGHFDHIYYLKEYLSEFNCFVYGSTHCLEKLDNEYKNESATLTRISVRVEIDKTKFKCVSENDTINNIKVISLPGHTKCGVGYIAENNLFCGDTLFLNGVGRCDLWDSNYKDLVNSINKIMDFKPINIYPGHGENFSI